MRRLLLQLAAVVPTATVPLRNLGLGSSAVRSVSWTLDESAILKMGVHLDFLVTTPKRLQRKGLMTGSPLKQSPRTIRPTEVPCMPSSLLYPR